MKIKVFFSKIFICSLIITLISTNIFAATTEITNDTSNEPEKLVYEFVDSINNGDVQTYISLFTKNNREEMESYLKRNGENDYFKENNIAIQNIAKLSSEVGKKSANISYEEYDAYDDIAIFYVEENIDVKEDNGIDNDDILDNGISYRDYVIVKEEDEWKILRVSTPNLIQICNANEGFGTDREKEKLNMQKTRYLH